MVTLPPSSPSQNPPPAPATAHSVASVAGVRPGLLRSTDLLGSQQTVEIEHNGHVYRLQNTKAGKLILTK